MTEEEQNILEILMLDLSFILVQPNKTTEEILDKAKNRLLEAYTQLGEANEK